MPKKARTILTIYLTAATLIAGWWLLAFNSADKKNSPSQLSLSRSSPLPTQPTPSLLKYISPLERVTLHQALAGDFSLMTKLISEWDVDAQILQSFGIASAKRISQENYLRVQLLNRLLNHSSPEELHALCNLFRAESVYDDNHLPFALQKPYARVLPQTHSSASILLAIAQPEQITAIPGGMRKQTHIFPLSITSKVSLDIESYSSERLYRSRPELAFVAQYSHPSTIEALKNQGIELFNINEIDTLDQINNALLRIGNIVNRPMEAELLTLFIDAAMQTIDNRFIASNFNAFNQEMAPRILMLNYRSRYSTPTSKTLAGQLMQRAGISLYAKDCSAWSLPLDQEQIVNINPDCMIIAAANQELLKPHVEEDPAFQNITAIRNKQLHMIDDDVQQFPSQYIVLAYFDLFNALFLLPDS